MRNIPISQSEPGWNFISSFLVDSISHTGRFCFSHFVLHFLCPLRFGVGEIFSKNRNEIEDKRSMRSSSVIRVLIAPGTNPEIYGNIFHKALVFAINSQTKKGDSFENSPNLEHERSDIH